MNGNQGSNNPTIMLATWIENIFHGVAVSEANTCIHEFVETRECWNAAVSLLFESEKAHIRYFTANILYSKVSVFGIERTLLRVFQSIRY